MKNTTVTFKNKKTDGEKITMLTAYDYTTAKLEDCLPISVAISGRSASAGLLSVWLPYSFRLCC